MTGFRCGCGPAIDCTYPKCKEGVEMSKSITQMLRDYARDHTTTTYHDALIHKAATEIEFYEERWDQLRQQLDALKHHQIAYEAQAEQELASRYAEVNLLRDALDQLLDDMGEEGHCVCPAAKQLAKDVLAATKEHWAEKDVLEMRSELAAAKAGADTAWAQAHRLALELECLIMDTKDNAIVSKWWDSAFEAIEEYNKLKPGAAEDAEAWAKMRKVGI